VRLVNEESTLGPSERDPAGRPAPDGGQPSPDSTPTVAWNADSAPQQQWDSPLVYPQSGAQASWNQSPAADSWSGTPTSVPPQSGPPWSEDPISGSGWAGDVVPQYQPRIPPTPRKQRKPVLQLVVGIVVAAVVAGVGGYFLGAATGGDKGTPAPNPTSSSAGLSLFDAAQAAANKTKLDGELAGLAQPWLSSTLGACVSNVEKGAPPLAAGESRHVTCRYGSAWVHFVVYKSDTDKNSARTYRQQLNLNSDEVAPGVHDPSRTVGGVSGSPGKVIEYAYRQPDGQSLCGLSWERDADPLAAMMIEANCEEDLDGKWEPLRDLWQRHS
jgi:hypothetical protein